MRLTFSLCKINAPWLWTLCLALALCLPPRAALGDVPDDDANWSLSDRSKQLHVVAAYAFTLTETLVLEHYKVPRWKAVLISIGTTLLIGAFKEKFLDASFSVKDMYANAGGATAAGLMTFIFKF